VVPGNQQALRPHSFLELCPLLLRPQIALAALIDVERCHVHRRMLEGAGPPVTVEESTTFWPYSNLLLDARIPMPWIPMPSIRVPWTRGLEE
jgi:hypothetical protein